MNDREKMRQMIDQLRAASKAYYAEDREIMSNYAYDQMYDELQALEKKTGVILAGSPTVEVGYEAVDFLPKETHDSPMLSLDKTKDREQLRSFIGSHKTLLSWKMDGLTIVLTYQDGVLSKAVTRGNGVIGEVVTNNAKTFVNLPATIPFKGTLVVRGEAFIKYSDFERINAEITDVDAKYKNPRNLCSGSVRQLDNRITAQRNVNVYLFSMVSASELTENGSLRAVDFNNSHEKEFDWLREQGFETVEYRSVTADSLDDAMQYFSEQVAVNDFPSDGLVALYDDIAYGQSLGRTAKFPRNAYAFKWADEKRTTVLREIEWSPSRTGLLNPVAIFEPVELEGTTVSRASVHNVSIVRELELGIGDEIEVYKANMIIPQIAENLTRSGAAAVPDICPACGGATRIQASEGVETLYCENPACPAKAMKSFTLFASRDALNIDGVSEATLEKFMAHGLIHEEADLFRIDQHRDTIVEMEGFGAKSYDKLWDGIQKARVTTLSRLLYAMGIPSIGVATAKVISRSFEEDIDRVRHASQEEMASVDGIGDVIAGTYVKWWLDAKNNERFDHVLQYLTLEKEFTNQGEQKLAGKIFVITGSLEKYANRNALKELIEQQGGKVTGSVSAKTDYLINNDVNSTSSKNKKARELQIPILSEDDFQKLL